MELSIPGVLPPAPLAPLLPELLDRLLAETLFWSTGLFCPGGPREPALFRLILDLLMVSCILLCCLVLSFSASVARGVTSSTHESSSQPPLSFPPPPLELDRPDPSSGCMKGGLALPPPPRCGVAVLLSPSPLSRWLYASVPWLVKLRSMMVLRLPAPLGRPPRISSDVRGMSSYPGSGTCRPSSHFPSSMGRESYLMKPLPSGTEALLTSPVKCPLCPSASVHGMDRTSNRGGGLASPGGSKKDDMSTGLPSRSELERGLRSSTSSSPRVR
mmetsp:Transcript_32729/g.74724  ORF Transcript_32729/g.74724 Transcript_32729/m.74724 type:complete len:272 (+) Transcript_32729:404-1219(+)